MAITINITRQPEGKSYQHIFITVNESDIPRSTTGKVQRHFVEKMIKSYFSLGSTNLNLLLIYFFK